MSRVCLIGKNSFLYNAFSFVEKHNTFSHKQINKINFNNYDKLVLLSFPRKYFLKKEKKFLFEKKLFKKFKNKEIHYISTSKLYPMKIKCSEKIKEINLNMPYVYNKFMIENMLRNIFKNMISNKTRSESPSPLKSRSRRLTVLFRKLIEYECKFRSKM